MPWARYIALVGARTLCIFLRNEIPCSSLFQSCAIFGISVALHPMQLKYLLNKCCNLLFLVIPINFQVILCFILISVWRKKCVIANCSPEVCAIFNGARLRSQMRNIFTCIVAKYRTRLATPKMKMHKQCAIK